MKLKIELCDDVTETEVIIKCLQMTDEVKRIEKTIRSSMDCGITLRRDNTEYYLPLDNILFFETDKGAVRAHTCEESFEVPEKLYELENTLPMQFIRVSKSAILNVNHVYSVERNIASASLVKFADTHKRIYISRSYYKNFKSRILERRAVK